MSNNDGRTPQEVLDELEGKLSALTKEYADGHINPAQYNAIYRYYSEKRALIEHILDTSPDNPTWRAVSENHNTDYLIKQFEARVLYYVVFKRGNEVPLVTDGKIPRKGAEQVIKLLQSLWGTTDWRKGVARKSLGEGMFLVLCIGDQAMTLCVFLLQPSTIQINRLKDMHEDFERANRNLLKKDVTPERMVFPQRGLIENK